MKRWAKLIKANKSEAEVQIIFKQERFLEETKGKDHLAYNDTRRSRKQGYDNVMGAWYAMRGSVKQVQ